MFGDSGYCVEVRLLRCQRKVKSRKITESASMGAVSHPPRSGLVQFSINLILDRIGAPRSDSHRPLLDGIQAQRFLCLWRVRIRFRQQPDAAKYAVRHWHYGRSLPCSKTARLGVWENDKFIGVVVFAWGLTPSCG